MAFSYIYFSLFLYQVEIIRFNLWPKYIIKKIKIVKSENL